MQHYLFKPLFLSNSSAQLECQKAMFYYYYREWRFLFQQDSLLGHIGSNGAAHKNNFLNILCICLVALFLNQSQQ